MTFHCIRLEDGFPENPKVRKVGPAGVALYVSGLCYCSRQLSDGLIPDEAVQIIAEMVGVKRHREVIEALTKARLWKRVRGGYMVPDYRDFNPSREEISRKREENRRRQADWRAAQRNGVTDALVTGALVSGVKEVVEVKSTDQLVEYPKIAERLGTERYHSFQKLMRLVRGGDAGTANVVASYCKRLPVSEIDDVRMAYRRGAAAGKVVAALKDRVWCYETGVKQGDVVVRGGRYA